ncbi:MAG: NAD-dependent epimerase/dehydratase family protein [Acidobacteria bacterium]|nr:NAD-dependent epimerase/dehydratase family protein [Acidobacteriota bacterium]MCI0567303.1 NAD-dependent epimerase/dehydratase family protein [Acidobacteriota bacterium]
MRVFVTGATGFVGWHLVEALLARGDEVRCLARPASAALLDPSKTEVTLGDLTNFDSLRRGLAGIEAVYHCAADYRLYVADPEAMYAANVEGTRNILRAAAEAGVQRVVYTSTVGALGLNADASPADEQTPVGLSDMVGHYKRSKFLAERVAEEWVSKGLPLVIVNPSTPVGERDIKPTATGRMILDFLRGRIPVYVDTGLNLVDVRDVAAGHILAMERGRIGEKYILGHKDMSLKAILDSLSSIAGLPSPRLRVPHWLPLAVAAADTALARVRGGKPRFELDAVRLSRKKMFFDSGKAVRDLGLPQTPVEEALGRAVRWFRLNGYVEGRAA